MNSRIFPLLFILATTIVAGACADPISPSPSQRIHPESANLGRYPTEEEYAQMPPEFRESPKLKTFEITASFSSSHARGYGYMEFWANWYRLVMRVDAYYKGQFAGTSNDQVSEQGYYLPNNLEVA